MLNRLLRWSPLVFAFVFAWELLLFITTAQPVPANDSFFYDGPVVNLLLHGKYVNPSLAFALPIAATRLFSAYPPFYQFLLIPWMSVFGTSAISAMGFHLVLLGLYLIVLHAIFRNLNLPTRCQHLAGLFLFQFTFHDRPDSLAHLFGMLAVFCWVRWRCKPASDERPSANNGWSWAMAFFSLLTFCTSLQVGAVYLSLLWILLIAAYRFAKDPLPVLPMIFTVVAPAVLIALVKFGFPELWTGFVEHARQTPSLTGFRAPQMGDILKIVRTVPGALAAAFLLPWVMPNKNSEERTASIRWWLVGLCSSLVVIAIVGASLLVVTSNMIAIAGYFQPLVVGTFLAAAQARSSQRQGQSLRQLAWLFPTLALLSGVRAVGMSTWGVACASDFGYAKTIERIRQESASTSAGKTIVASAAYLYEGARHPHLRWIHSDWLAPAQKDEVAAQLQELLRTKPAKLILTQFDYFRRYEPLLAQLKAQGHDEFQVINTAKLRTPDSIPSIRKVIQHISWAPVIINMNWK